MALHYLKEILLTKRVILLCGSGGVGKTTTAAAIAIRSAMEGKKTIVVTIDPAKRLANSLGLQELGNEPQKIDISSLHPNEKAKELWGMMLDTKRTFDELIGKYAPDKETYEKILSNNIYKHLSSTLAGSQEYMAMEKLYELYQEKKYDLIVVDTPPSRHALDFLDAPQKLSDFLDESIFKFFILPTSTLGSIGLKLFSWSGALVLKLIERLTGLEPLEDLSEFLRNFQNMYQGFKQRAEEVSRFLKIDETSFLLVTTPTHIALEEAKYFYKRLEENKMPFGGFVINRVNPLFHSAGIDHPTLKLLIEGRISIDPDTEICKKFAQILDKFRNVGEEDRFQITELMNQFGKMQRLILIPYFSDDVHDLRGLEELNRYLFDESFN
ncbi:MAG: hypothetical protein A3F16_01070 [Deltaproteobacteria bacterium RIFCSPHIGHO2_12_FULL_43_9]|nr:MAG: hypothetical protein A3F16_01070 [Deltaproteobacteria bacterium RIFCSPHIGHO2_12_FULL_43_9]